MTACPHGFPSPASCTACMYEGNMPDPPPKPKAEFTMSAAYRTGCPGCRDEIQPGDTIGLVGDDWLCPRCYR